MPSFRRTIARSRGQRPVMKILKGAIYVALHQTQWQSPCKPPRGREQCHVNEFTLGRLRERVTWPTDALIRLHLEFCIFTKRLFYKKAIF